jgi:ketosteroid isomerase-like protein
MPRHVFLLAAMALTATAATAGSPDLEAERDALFRLDKAWARAAAAKDVEKTVSFWTDDARVFPPGQPVVIGKEALRQYVSGGFAVPGFSIQWQTSDFVVSASGDVAYGVGTNTVTVNSPEGKPLTERGRAITVWKKIPGGDWKCVLDIWNAEPAASPVGAR